MLTSMREDLPQEGGVGSTWAPLEPPPLGPAARVLHEHLMDLSGSCEAIMRGEGDERRAQDPFWTKDTTRLASLVRATNEENGQCKPQSMARIPIVAAKVGRGGAVAGGAALLPGRQG